MDHNLTFDQLPNAVTLLTKEVVELKRLITQKQEQSTKGHHEQFLTVGEAANFLRLKVPTVYSKVHRGELPYMKRSKRLYFSRTELATYLKEGRAKTSEEIRLQAEKGFLNKK